MDKNDYEGEDNLNLNLKIGIVFIFMGFGMHAQLASLNSQERLPEFSDENPSIVASDIYPPVRISPLNIKYPEDAKHNKVEGTVILQLTLNASGTVEKVVVLQGQPYGMTEAGLAAVKNLKFNPAFRNETKQPVPCLYTITIHFVLDQKAKNEPLASQKNGQPAQPVIILPSRFERPLSDHLYALAKILSILISIVTLAFAVVLFLKRKSNKM